ENLIDVAVDCHHPIETAGVRVGVELNQNALHERKVARVRKPKRSTRRVNPVAHRLLSPILPFSNSSTSRATTHPRTDAWRWPSSRASQSPKALPSWRGRSTAWSLHNCIGRFSCRRSLPNG